MAGTRSRRIRTPTLAALRRQVESVDRALRASEAPQRAATKLAVEVRKHVDSLSDLTATDTLRLQNALARLNALADRQARALRKAAATAAIMVDLLR